MPRKAILSTGFEVRQAKMVNVYNDDHCCCRLLRQIY